MGLVERLRKSTVYGLNGQGAYFVIALSLEKEARARRPRSIEGQINIMKWTGVVKLRRPMRAFGRMHFVLRY